MSRVSHPPFEGREATDPGRPSPVESLYRDPAGGPTPRSGLRQYKPTLTPPEDRGTDPYGWLFRRDEPAPAGRRGLETDREPESTPVRTRIAVSPRVAGPSGSRRPRRGGRAAGVVVLAVLMAAAGALVGYLASRPGDHPTSTNSTPASAPSAAASIRPLGATTNYLSPAAKDDGGTTVTYGVANIFDGNPSTAWRYDGAGVGATVSFTFEQGTTLTRVGLVNGYSKTDPATQANRYPEYRRITAVTWIFADGTRVRQSLGDGLETVQMIDLPAAESGGSVTVQIDASTAPGSTSPNRNAVLIPEVLFS